MNRKVAGLSLAGVALTLIFYAALSSRVGVGGRGFLTVGVALFLLLAALVALGTGRTRV
jgi:hypothetical protein